MADWDPIAKVYDPLKAGSIDGTDVEPHDRAVWRAMSATYKPNKAVVGDPLLTLFVARLNPQTTEEKLHQVFSKYGDIQRLRLVRDLVTGFSKGYAFIEYKEERSVSRARREANKLVVDQHEVFVDFEQERTLRGWVPRRMGGGLGGKKESGQLRFGGRDRPFRKPINVGMEERRGWDRGRDRQDWGRHREDEWSGRGRRENRDRDRNWDKDRDRSRQRR
ncbi:U11/U12 small nuclear ribonucleoprotein 35 kDa protein [Gouania willdenowi]|uniref:U11/U12 small nuclear ribonucleoprotein 35 kDa protein n=1 Tax=Gouania willdenowi TaxID=441366 RepID=UPI001055F046|nr:U11/U12 small nuclear ribonucleoprotein 35 kDa protein [Gouania willdenowi]